MTTTSTTFELKPGQAREIHDDAVEALDAALSNSPALDPKWILKFEHGGPQYEAWRCAPSGTTSCTSPPASPR